MAFCSELSQIVHAARSLLPESERPWLTFVVSHSTVFTWLHPPMPPSQLPLNLGCACGSRRTKCLLEETRKAFGISKSWMQRFGYLIAQIDSLDWYIDTEEPDADKKKRLFTQIYDDFRSLLFTLEEEIGGCYRIRMKAQFESSYDTQQLWFHIVNQQAIEYYIDEETNRSYSVKEIRQGTKSDKTGRYYYLLANYLAKVYASQDKTVSLYEDNCPDYRRALFRACRLGYGAAIEEALCWMPDYEEEPELFATYFRRIKIPKHLQTPRICFYKGIYYLHVRKWPRAALRCFEFVVEAEMKSGSGAHYIEAYIEVVKAALFGKIARRDYKKAFSLLHRLLGRGWQDSRIYYYMGYMYEKGLYVEQNTVRAIQHYEHALRDAQENVEIFQRLAALSPEAAEKARSC